jgi:undecaprenyl phosphate-alpha-L-ara4FN deformylase
VPGALNAFTGHAELEGMHYLDWFAAFLAAAEKRGVVFVNLADEAAKFADNMPLRAQFLQGTIDGRSGTLALQGPFV